MSKKEIIKKLEKVWEILDKIQESDLLQDEEEDKDTAIWNIGEAMGCIDNAIDILRDRF